MKKYPLILALLIFGIPWLVGGDITSLFVKANGSEPVEEKQMESFKVSKQWVEKIEKLAPEEPEVEPSKKRKVLLFDLITGFDHWVTPHTNEVMRILGEKTGAYKVKITDDIYAFESKNLEKYDAVVLNNNCSAGPRRNMFLDQLDKDHSLVKAFEGKAFVHVDEPYLFTGAYGKKDFRPLLYMNSAELSSNKEIEGDIRYVSWIRKQGKGRVFYVSPSHNAQSFEDPRLLKFFLDGTQYVLGDLECDDSPLETAECAGDKFEVLPPGSVKFTGYFENDIQRSIEHWNKGVVPYDSLADLFRSGRKFFAQGEMWGKAVRSGSMFYRYTGDAELKRILDATVADLLSTVRDNGSISCSEIRDQPDSKGGDLWERKYVLLGLHGYHTHVEQDPAVLKAMLDQADCIVEQVGPEPKTRIVDQGWSPNHIESSTLLEPMMRLYNMTGKPEYLEFARYIVEEEGGALGHDIIGDAFLNRDPMDIGGVYPKAYEMMSLFEGLAEYYRVTGNERWKQAFMNLFHKIIEQEITIIGNAGGDVYHPAVMGEAWGRTAFEQTNPDMNRMMETCVGVTWLKLCSQILRLTGDPLAMDMIEKYAYNGLIGAMKPGGDGFSYVNRLNGSKTITTGWGGMINEVHVTCCNLNGPMGLAYLPYVAVMDSREGPVLNLYNPLETTLTTPGGNALKLAVETDFPLSGKVNIRLDPAKDEAFVLRLRIPAWSERTMLKINGESVEVSPGSYAELDRRWQSGDLVELQLDIRCRVLDAPRGSNRAGDNFQALVRGPVVLSRDENLDPDYDKAVNLRAENGYIQVTPLEPELPGTRMQFRIPVEGGSIKMVDYASVNNWNGSHICTWLPTAPRSLITQDNIPLEGTWNVRLDPENRGLREKWFNKAFSGEITLPGTLDEYGIGKPEENIHLGKLTSNTRYVGAAWYQREVDIPESWNGRRIQLFLERANWTTTVYIDGVHTPVKNSLSTPDIHDLTALLAPGKHIITIHVDNTPRINLGHTFGNMLWCHALTEETQTNWNGIIGRIGLISTPEIWIDDIQLYPDFKEMNLKLTARIGNSTGKRCEGLLEIEGVPGQDGISRQNFELHGKDTLLEIYYPLGDEIRYWSEHDPHLFNLKASLSSSVGRHEKELLTGIRDFRASGDHFLLNGRSILLRGELNCCIFPLTGYPPMTKEGWIEVLQVYRDYGLNHVRFHSWCPPEAAFQAADEMGFIIQAENPLWDGYGLVGSDPERAAFILREAERIIETYGHHPSFCLMSMGNELGDGKDPYLAYLVDFLRKRDPRRLYTSTTHPADNARADDYFAAAATSKGTVRGINPLDDFRERVEVLDKPLIVHEVGQPCIYPDYSEIAMYTGHLKARNLETFRKSLEARGMLDLAEDFHRASGALALEIYKENIEAQLRTPNIAGFQLLGLQDFPGQGTALVGMLDAHLETKGIVSPEQWRRFCNESVLLLRMPGFVYSGDQVLEAGAEIVHYGAADIQGKAVRWEILRRNGKKLASGAFPARDIPTGQTTSLGSIRFSFDRFRNPEQLEIVLSLPGTEIENSWKLWVYPTTGQPEVPEGILLSRDLDDRARECLESGGKVLLIPEAETLEKVEKHRWNPVFWAMQLFQQSKGMGILCDPDHPVFDAFPTGFHSDWQWRSLLDQSEALVYDYKSSRLDPVIQVVPDFNTNLPMSLLMETRAGKGSLVICTIDLLNREQDSLTTDALLASLLDYMDSPAFRPDARIQMEELDELLKATAPNSFTSEQPDLNKALVNVSAGILASIGTNKLWAPENGADLVDTLADGFSYHVDGSIFRDHNMGVWYERDLKVQVSCPAGFSGHFYVFLDDPYAEGRAAHLWFCGQDKGELRRYDRGGAWLEYRISPEMSAAGELIFLANTMNGPNSTVKQIVIVPD